MIEFHGDSTQFGTIVVGEESLVSAILPSDVVSHLLGVDVANFGVGGTTLQDALTGTIYPGGLNFEQHIALSSADVIVANWGINESFLPEVTPANQKARWETLRDICTAASKTLIIETPSPIDLAQQPGLYALAEASKTVTGVGVSDMMNQILGGFADWKDNLDTPGVHPNKRLYTWIGVRLARDIERILE